MPMLRVGVLYQSIVHTCLTYAYYRLIPGGVVEIHCINLKNLSIWDQTLPFYTALHAVSKVSRGLLYWQPWLIQICVLTLITVHI
jgi:hypothetical protein